MHIDIERYLELMPPDIERECRELKERKQDIMDRKNNVTLNISGGQFNISKDSSTLNAVQNNGTSGTELEKIIKGIMDNVNELNKNDADQITDIAEMVQGWRFYTNSMGKIGKTDTGGFFNETWVYYINP